MRLLPRSLFNRLVLVLLGGLVLAQVLSFAIHMQDRGELLSRASGMQSAQRIADIVRLLETLSAPERQRIAGVLNTPDLTISLDQPSAIARERADQQSAHGVLFGAMLRRMLGDSWPLEVAVRDVDALWQPGAMRGFKGPGKSFGKGPGMGAMEGAADMPFVPPMRYFAQPGVSFVAEIRLHDGTLVAFDSMRPAEAAGWPYRMLLSVGVLLIAVIGVSVIAVRWATKPLKALADAADELGKDIHRAPLAEQGPLEVVRAARAFNVMQARLIRYINDRTRILAAMSHDLKTPITRLRLRSELLDDAQLRSRFTADLQEMESMVGATLDFMRGLGNEEPLKPLDVTALLESLQADMRETGGQVTIEGAVQKPYPAKPQSLKRCLTNLLDNAIKYGKSAVISVSDDENRLQIRIRDEGPGIPEPELEKVFEPFYRVEGSRNRETGGTGLGLTIARSIAEGHGGHLTLKNHSEGGLEVILTLPRIATQPDKKRKAAQKAAQQ